LQQKLIDRFLKNIEYLQKEHPKTAQKVIALNDALNNAHHSARYELIYEDGYFDVVELQSGKKLYGSSSIEYDKRVAKSVNFTRDENAFNTARNFSINTHQLKQYKTLDIRDNPIAGFADIIHHIEANSSRDDELKSIDKFIFFGSGLGGHIVEVDKKLSPKMLLIVEDDLELFRLSLFTCPYYQLSKKDLLIFSVFEDESEFDLSSNRFLNTSYYLNHHIKFFEMLSHSEAKLKQFHLRITSASHNLFSYSAIMTQYVKPPLYAQMGYKYLNILKPHFSSCKDKQAFVLVAAGPSLAKNISWLKLNQKKLIIVALTATLSTLEDAGIVPDITVHLDGFGSSIWHVLKLKDMEFFKDTLCLFSSRSPIEVLEAFNKEKVYLFESGTNYKKSFGNLSATCVGSTAYLLTLAFGAKEIYLLGLDLALDEGGHTHSSSHNYTKKLDTSLQDEDTMVFRRSVIKVEGNFRDSVFTIPAFKISIDSVNSSSLYFKKPTQNVYNLNDGAKFANTTPTDINSVKLNIDKKECFELIERSFMAHSEVGFDADVITKRLEYVDLLKARVASFAKSSKKLLPDLVILLQDLTSSPQKEISFDVAFILQEYFRLFVSYIFDFYNRSNIRDAKHSSKLLREMLSKQILNLLHIYQNDLLSTIEERQ